MYYFNARWYDAQTGRFISEDPALDGSNWHVYVSNNPLKYIDPTGMIFGLSNEESGEYDSDNKRQTDSKETDDDKGSDASNKKDPEKPKDPLNPEEGHIEPILPGSEIPDEVVKALIEAGIPLVGENPTADDLDKALKNMQRSSVSSEEIKELFNQGMKELQSLDPETLDKIIGVGLIVSGTAISGAAIYSAYVLSLASGGLSVSTIGYEGVKLGGTITAYGFVRAFGNSNQSVEKDMIQAIEPPMSEIGKRLNR